MEYLRVYQVPEAWLDALVGTRFSQAPTTKGSLGRVKPLVVRPPPLLGRLAYGLHDQPTKGQHIGQEEARAWTKTNTRRHISGVGQRW